MKHKKVWIVLGCAVVLAGALFIGRYGCKEIEKERQRQIEQQDIFEVQPLYINTNKPFEYGFITIQMEEGKVLTTYGRIKIVNDGRDSKPIEIVQDTTDLPKGTANDHD